MIRATSRILPTRLQYRAIMINLGTKSPGSLAPEFIWKKPNQNPKLSSKCARPYFLWAILTSIWGLRHESCLTMTRNSEIWGGCSAFGKVAPVKGLSWLFDNRCLRRVWDSKWLCCPAFRWCLFRKPPRPPWSNMILYIGPPTLRCPTWRAEIIKHLLLLLSEYHGWLKLHNHLSAPEELRLDDFVDDYPLGVLRCLIVRHESEDEADCVLWDHVALGPRFAYLLFLLR